MNVGSGGGSYGSCTRFRVTLHGKKEGVGGMVVEM